jgi:hypothetical protein
MGQVAVKMTTEAGTPCSPSYIGLIELGKRKSRLPDSVVEGLTLVLDLPESWADGNKALPTCGEARLHGQRLYNKRAHRNGRKAKRRQTIRKVADSPQLPLFAQQLPSAPVRDAYTETATLDSGMALATTRAIDKGVWAVTLGLVPVRENGGWVIRWGQIEGKGGNPGQALIAFERAMETL